MTELTHPLATVNRDELIARAEADPLRPRFHFVSPAGWLNDPNGVSQWNGTYHLFYQYNPEGAFHHRIQWGHATSTDLVTWSDQPVALSPDGPDSADADGCWSGVLVDDGGTPTIVYSGRKGERELPCVAVGSPDLLTWTKSTANPVIAAPPADVDVTAYRDHCVWREGKKWRQLLGSGIRGRGGTAFLYESEDLRSWDYIGPLFIGDASQGDPSAPDWTGTMWECVDLFRSDGGVPGKATVGWGSGGPGDEDSHVLVFSAWDDGVTHHPLYWTGRYANDAFEPRALHRLDYGGRYFYAPQSFRDESGRRIMFGWLQEGRDDAVSVEAGWSGVMSLPRIVSRDSEGALSFAPVPEVADLRRDHISVAPAVIGAGTSVHGVISEVSGLQLDLELELDLDPGAVVRLGVLESRNADGTAVEQTVIELSRDDDEDGGDVGRGGVSRAQGALRLDRTLSSLEANVDTDPRGGPIPVPGGRVSLRVIVDRSAVEIFANGKPLTARAYPQLGGGGVSLNAVAGSARVRRFDAWTMGEIFGTGRALFPEPVPKGQPEPTAETEEN